MIHLKRFIGIILLLPFINVAIFNDIQCPTLSNTLIMLLIAITSAFAGGGLMYGFSSYRDKLSAGTFSDDPRQQQPIIPPATFFFMVGLIIQFLSIILMPNL